MKRSHSYVYIWALLFSLMCFTACKGQENPGKKAQLGIEFPVFSDAAPGSQIADYIRHIFQDKNGGLWLGTNGKGVAYYDGDRISYFSNEEGFGGQQITGITEDLEGDIWFATNQGVVRYDWSNNKDGGQQFTNYTDTQYFGGQRFWSILADSKGNIWAGSVKGIYRFDGTSWTLFELPYPENVTGEFITKRTAWSITEDSAGNVWISSNGYGAFKYDGRSFTQYTEKDGLTDNSVDHILEDSKGNIWFGTRYGGLSRFDGNSFVNFTQKDGIIGNDEVCVVYEDKKGNIWFSSEGFGVYCYDGTSFTNFFKKQGLNVGAVQTILEDREGRLWVGGGGGLYRFDGKRFINVTKNGPWE